MTKAVLLMSNNMLVVGEVDYEDVDRFNVRDAKVQKINPGQYGDFVRSVGAGGWISPEFSIVGDLSCMKSNVIFLKFVTVEGE